MWLWMKLAKGYNGVAASCAAKAREAKRGAEVEQRRHDNLKKTLSTLFGFSF